MCNKTLKVGDKVIWRGAWGTKTPIETTIEGMELCTEGVCGEDITECVEDNYLDCVFDLANGHWCYGHQIDWEESIKLNKNKNMMEQNTYFLTKSEKSVIVEKVVSEVLSIVGDKKVPYVNLKVQGTFPNEIDWEFIYLGSVSDTKYRLNLDGCIYWDLKIFNPATGHPFEDLRNCEFLTDIFKE